MQVTMTAFACREIAMSNETQFAELIWDADGQPSSDRFGDVYFSRVNGLAETRHVFLQHNQLAERWAALAEDANFSIAETGFGTGLNFLCAWELWERSAPRGARLHFISCERFPLHPDDLRKALSLWPELQPLSDTLLDSYQALPPGWQHFSFSGGRINLTLLIGDAVQMFEQLDAQIDAWFLDGFAPAKNPDMWRPELFEQMARLSVPGTSMATFTCAGDVRRGLQAAGFQLNKVPGYGSKREMLCGHLQHPVTQQWQAPWLCRPEADLQQPRTALVIGAGLAGISSAWALARRGWQVTLLDRHSEPASEASGNPQGILYVRLSPHSTPLSRFVESSYGHCLRHLQALLPDDGVNRQACGVLQLPTDEAELKRLQALGEAGYPPSFLQLLDSQQASDLAGVAINTQALLFPAAGWANPPALCRAMLEQPGIRLLGNSAVAQLDHRQGQWAALDANGQHLATAGVAVICGAVDSLQLAQSAQLPLKPIRGQITHLPATPASRSLRTVLCGAGYISPARLDEHHVGASFRFDRFDSEPSEEENAGNLEMLRGLSPDMESLLALQQLQPAALKARAGLRCSTPDYLPVIGPLADADAFFEDYAELAKDASKKPDTITRTYPGLFVNTGHGSRGLVSCPLSAELLAAWVCNEAFPLPRDLVDALHPSRFLHRRLIRRQQ